jgi:hypothetical protein
VYVGSARSLTIVDGATMRVGAHAGPADHPGSPEVDAGLTPARI